jgi:dsDNA-specific endonuclease/ATPase MutS2
MDLNELWIGDRVRLINSGREGRFEGLNPEGKARIKVAKSVIITNGANLEMISEQEVFPDIDAFLRKEEEDASKVVREKSKKVNILKDCTLDLHIETLAPQMKNEPSGKILEFQLKESENFIKNAISRGNPHITIIHGKGQGVLKEAIEHQLKLFTEVKITFSKNGGGAVEVWL